MKTEIKPGLVLHLDPDKLEESGGTYTCGRDRRVRGGHFFVCLTAAEKSGTWTPMYSDDPRGERVAVPTAGRHGHPKWTKGVFFIHGGQVWTAAHEAIEAAAIAGGDRSSPGKRNSLDASTLKLE